MSEESKGLENLVDYAESKGFKKEEVEEAIKNSASRVLNRDNIYYKSKLSVVFFGGEELLDDVIQESFYNYIVNSKSEDFTRPGFTRLEKMIRFLKCRPNDETMQKAYTFLSEKKGAGFWGDLKNLIKLIDITHIYPSDELIKEGYILLFNKDNKIIKEGFFNEQNNYFDSILKLKKLTFSFAELPEELLQQKLEYCAKEGNADYLEKLIEFINYYKKDEDYIKQFYFKISDIRKGFGKLLEKKDYKKLKKFLQITKAYCLPLCKEEFFYEDENNENVSFYEEDTHQAYEKCFLTGDFDSFEELKKKTGTGEIKKKSEIKPKKSTIQKVFTEYLHKLLETRADNKYLSYTFHLFHHTGEKPDWPEEDIRKIYRYCIENPWVSTFSNRSFDGMIYLMELTKVEPNFSKEEIQQTYKKAIANMQSVFYEEFENLTGVKPILNEAEIKEGYKQYFKERVVSKKGYGDVDQIEDMIKYTNIIPDEETAQLIYDYFSDSPPQFLEFFEITKINPNEESIQKTLKKSTKYEYWPYWNKILDKFDIEPSEENYDSLIERLGVIYFQK